jgi:hypothetical protein
MLPEIKESSKKGFEAAAIKLGLSTELPNVSMLRPDLGLYLTAHYMLAVIVEAEKDGENNDITKHSKRKYENWFTAEDGYVAGSSGSGFSFYGTFNDYLTYTCVGARLSSNTREISEMIAETYIDLWEIIMLFVA